ncbi:MAG: H+transporting two-sector ATPase C subunit [Kiritimatiellae bacterium]|nr:H+transporting two-sector ATPase C subunit [Kiritimatiellia bacterium]
MERWIRTSKRVNKGLGIGALLLLTYAPLSLLGATGATADADALGSEPRGETEAVAVGAQSAKIRCWAFLAAAVATGIGSVAAAYAVACVGTSAMGAVAEKPELMGKSMIYVALAEGIAIYGLLIAIIILAKV